VVAAALGLIALTGDVPQWLAYGLGVYAVFSWVQSLKHRDPPTYRLIWGTPPWWSWRSPSAASPSSPTRPASGSPIRRADLLRRPARAGRFIPGLTAKEEVGTIVGWGGAFSAAIGVILGGYLSDLVAASAIRAGASSST
jgi:hypothetical protein